MLQSTCRPLAATAGRATKVTHTNNLILPQQLSDCCRFPCLAYSLGYSNITGARIRSHGICTIFCAQRHTHTKWRETFVFIRLTIACGTHNLIPNLATLSTLGLSQQMTHTTEKSTRESWVDGWREKSMTTKSCAERECTHMHLAYVCSIKRWGRILTDSQQHLESCLNSKVFDKPMLTRIATKEWDQNTYLFLQDKRISPAKKAEETYLVEKALRFVSRSETVCSPASSLRSVCVLYVRVCVSVRPLQSDCED